MGLSAPWRTWYRPGELARLLHRHDVAWVLDHADRRPVPAVVQADRAQLALGHVEAADAQRHALLHGHDGIGQAQGVLGRHLEEMESDALGRLGTDARKPAELVDEGLQRTREDGHSADLFGTGKGLQEARLGRGVHVGDVPEL